VSRTRVLHWVHMSKKTTTFYFLCTTLSVCLLAPVVHAAQAIDLKNESVGAAVKTAPLPADLAKEAIVYEKIITNVREEADGTGIRSLSARVRIQAEAGVKNLAVLQFTYTASNQQLDIIQVRVIKPDGTIVVTPAYNIQDVPAEISRSAPMYSDIHEKHIAVKGLGVGDTLEYQTTLRTLTADVPGQFWLEYNFEKNAIVLEEDFDLDLPSDKPVHVSSRNLDPTILNRNGRKLYHWTTANLSHPDPDAPAESIKNWKPSVQLTTFSSWEEVGRWYASLQKDALVVTPTIQAKADALTKGLTSNDDKLHAIFKEVAQHIHYVGLDFGIGRYQPHPAEEVLSNEYGDCKDKHTLLATLLKAAGIEAWPVLISSSRPLDPETPSPAQFDHVITLVPLDGKLLWMDTTPEVAPINILFATLRDKQALAIPATKPAYLERTAAVLPFKQLTEFRIEGKLSDQGQLKAHIAQKLTGDADLLLRILGRSIPQAQWKEFMQAYMGQLGFGGEVSDPQLSPVEKVDDPFELSCEYSRDKFGEWDDHRIFPPMPLMGVELMAGVKEKRPADEVNLGSPGEVHYHAEVELPKGWSLTPASAVNLVEDWAEYHATYAFTNGKFIADRSMIIKKTSAPLAAWDQYLAWRRAIYTDNVRTTVLDSGDSNYSTGEVRLLTGLTPANVDGAIAPIQKLRALATKLDADPPPGKEDVASVSDAAQKNMQEIEALSLKQSEVHAQLFSSMMLDRAWCLRGWIALSQKDFATADTYLRLSWRLGLDRMSGYLLGQLLEAKGNRVAAIHQYELAHFASASPYFELSSTGNERVRKIADAYHRLTGKALPTSAFRGGNYDGSFISEIDKEREFPRLLPSTRLTGTGYFLLIFAEGKQPNVVLIGGDSGFDKLIPLLHAWHWPAQIPSGENAQIVREVQMICTPYAGCDAHLIALGSYETPPMRVVALPLLPGNRQIKVERSTSIVPQ